MNNVAQLYMEYPTAPFNIIDGWSKAGAMLNGQYKSVLCDLEMIDDIAIIIKDICQKCDFSGYVQYGRETGKEYDLVIGRERNGQSPYTACAGDGKYRPIFWYEDSDLQWYKENIINGIH